MGYSNLSKGLDS